MPPHRTTWHVSPRFTWAGSNYFGETPSTALTSTGQLVTRIAAMLDRQQQTEGLVLLTAEAARLVGLTYPQQSNRQPALDSAAAAGWQSSAIGDFTAFYAKSRPTVHVGQLGHLEAIQDPDGWPFRAVYPADSVTALQAFHTLTGVAWQAGPPVMGLELMHRTMTTYQVIGQKGRRKPDLRDDSTPDEAGVSMWTPAMWLRGQLTRYAHGYDKRRAGITAAGVAKLSPAKLIRSRRAFDSKRAGWWLVPVPAWNVAEMPHPFGPGAADTARRVGGHNRMWVTTATLDLASELAARGLLSMPEVIDSLTGPARPVLAPWQQLLERAYAEPTDTRGEYDEVAQQLLRSAVKTAGNRGIGMLGKADGKSSIWRPDWKAAIDATKQANAWRIAYRIGETENRWPLAFDDDKIWYGSDDDDPTRSAPKAFNLRDDTPGSYRAETTVDTPERSINR